MHPPSHELLVYLLLVCVRKRLGIIRLVGVLPGIADKDCIIFHQEHVLHPVVIHNLRQRYPVVTCNLRHRVELAHLIDRELITLYGFAHFVVFYRTGFYIVERIDVRVCKGNCRLIVSLLVPVSCSRCRKIPFKILCVGIALCRSGIHCHSVAFCRVTKRNCNHRPRRCKTVRKDSHKLEIPIHVTVNERTQRDSRIVQRVIRRHGIVIFPVNFDIWLILRLKKRLLGTVRIRRVKCRSPCGFLCSHKHQPVLRGNPRRPVIDALADIEPLPAFLCWERGILPRNLTPDADGIIPVYGACFPLVLQAVAGECRLALIAGILIHIQCRLGDDSFFRDGAFKIIVNLKKHPRPPKVAARNSRHCTVCKPHISVCGLAISSFLAAGSHHVKFL